MWCLPIWEIVTPKRQCNKIQGGFDMGNNELLERIDIIGEMLISCKQETTDPATDEELANIITVLDRLRYDILRAEKESPMNKTKRNDKIFHYWTTHKEESYQSIADKFGVSYGNLRQIISRRKIGK